MEASSSFWMKLKWHHRLTTIIRPHLYDNAAVIPLKLLLISTKIDIISFNIVSFFSTIVPDFYYLKELIAIYPIFHLNLPIVPKKHLLDNVPLTQQHQLERLLENRRVFNLKNCELNIYENYQEASQIPISFNDFVITSMVRGKKVMHIFDDSPFDYLPGETMIIPAQQAMKIDFPTSSQLNPTQCLALAIDRKYIKDTLEFLNRYYQEYDEAYSWELRFNQYHFPNDPEIAETINKIVRICTSGDLSKNILVDLSMKELLIRLLQTQRLSQYACTSKEQGNHTRLHFVLKYIHDNLSEKISIELLCKKAYLGRNQFFKWFKEQCGISPVEYITLERIKMAKKLMSDMRYDMRTISNACGFSDVNYFIRVFKKIEGITPSTYQSLLRLGHPLII